VFESLRLSGVAGLAAALGVALIAVPAIAQDAPASPPATPQAPCGAGSNPEPGIQGRVSREDHESGRAAQGYTCNAELIGSYIDGDTFGTIGGFKVERYTDAAGHDCAYYDAALMFPTGVVDAEAGVNVLDMTDPTAPVLTANLRTPAMLQTHESLVLSSERGILAAVGGTLATSAGVIDIYDISGDCRTPQLLSVSPMGVVGHESGLSPDGNTFWSASPSTKTLIAVDISDPLLPIPLWQGDYDSHGLSISADGNRAYIAGTGTGLIILDTSQIQARVADPVVVEVARLDWATRSIPQNAVPFTVDGHPYVMEIDEFGTQSKVGAARIIDIGDETNPTIISDLRLEVHDTKNFAAQASDPNEGNPIVGYAGHYCNVPTRVDPTIVACSMILSGLRVFDITDLHNPVEVAYYNAPVQPRPGFDELGVFEASNWAMSSPSFVPERQEIWYTDAFQGFFAVRLTNGAWPEPRTPSGDTGATAPAPPMVADAGDDLPATGVADGLQALGKVLLGAALLLGGNQRRRRRVPAGRH